MGDNSKFLAQYFTNNYGAVAKIIFKVKVNNCSVNLIKALLGPRHYVADAL